LLELRGGDGGSSAVLETNGWRADAEFMNMAFHFSSIFPRDGGVKDLQHLAPERSAPAASNAIRSRIICRRLQTAASRN
jgi:hypothetical protein